MCYKSAARESLGLRVDSVPSWTRDLEYTTARKAVPFYPESENPVVEVEPVQESFTGVHTAEVGEMLCSCVPVTLTTYLALQNELFRVEKPGTSERLPGDRVVSGLAVDKAGRQYQAHGPAPAHRPVPGVAPLCETYSNPAMSLEGHECNVARVTAFVRLGDASAAGIIFRSRGQTDYFAATLDTDRRDDPGEGAPLEMLVDGRAVLSYQAPFKGSTSGGMSLGRFSSSASAESLQTNELSTYKSKGRELAQAMLSEIEDLLRGFDADLKKLHNKSRYASKRSEGRSWSDVVLQSTDSNVSSSAGASQLPSRSRLSFGIRDQPLLRRSTTAVQSICEEEDGEDAAFMALIRNIYKMVSTEIAPKLHGVTQEVTELRKNNDLLSEKVEQQRIRNDQLLEEFEDLQTELRAKDEQLREQRRVSKNLNIYQGENASLKVKLDSLRVRVEKLGGSSPPQQVVREVQAAVDAPCQRASSNDWLKKENENLQREVARWRAETSEKDILINELKDVIKNFTVPETPRSPMQRKLSAARPEALLSAAMGASRAVSEAGSLDSQVGTALTLETPRGRIRSSLFERLSPLAAVRRSPSATTLAQDLRISPPVTTESSKDIATGITYKGRISRRSGFPSAPPRAASTGVDSADTAAGFGGLRAAPSEEVGQLLEVTSEAMERALLEVEDIRASRIKQAGVWEDRNTHMKQRLLEAEEKLRAATADVQALTSERNAALIEQREAQEKVEKLRKQLEASRSEAAELQAALEKTENEMQKGQKAAAVKELRLMEAVTVAEKQIAALRDMLAFRDGLIMSIARNTNDWLLKKHLQVNETVGESDVQTLGTTSGREELPLRRPWMGPVAANGKHEEVVVEEGCTLPFCGSRQLTQHHPDGSRGQKLRVVCRSKDDTCCSTLNCLSLWSNGATRTAQPLYSIQPLNAMEGGVVWPSRNSHLALKTAMNMGK
ncbi:uncharacterized protein EMH_0010190 [Eimeria mitis]|uniref:Uncharacterized protein n=1 Tax=Eimeria mitis TaxID=44415 RepID=U6KE24_9EIME|nr:uncharacterized protein EMH_0010190 [Eimeria mitis]CDJ36199.1 hypothetical protein, conserved [Eimeria mitis]